MIHWLKNYTRYGIAILLCLGISILAWFDMINNEFWISIILFPSLFIWYLFIVIFNFYLQTTLLFQKKQLWYILATILCIFGGAIFANLFVNNVNFNYKIDSFAVHTISILAILILATLVRLLRQNLNTKLQFIINEKKIIAAELAALKKQLNPHFLFNTLNSIYVQSLQENSEISSKMVMQLSDLLRYQLEITKKEKITLQQELDFIQNYINFEKRRLTPLVNFTFIKNLENYNLLIAPNMLITLVENAFKYGIIPGKNCEILIELRETNKLLTLYTKNEIAQPISSTKIGLKNLQERLAYTYPQKHSLELEEKESLFIAKLTMQL